jgi:hypothetical protein
MSVPFEELEDSPRISFSRTGGRGQAVRKFLIAWSDYTNFILDLMGYWTLVGGVSTYVQSTVSFPNWPNLLADDVDIQPFSTSPDSKVIPSLSSDPNSFEKALVTVTYRQVQDDSNRHPGPSVPSGTILEFSSEVAAEMMTLPGHQLFYKSGMSTWALEASQVGGEPIGSEDFNFTWSRVPYPPWAAIIAQKGTLNNATFAGHDPGKLLFLGAQRRIQFQVNQVSLWTISYHFKSKTKKWTEKYKPTAAGGFGPGWYDLVDGGGNPLLDSTNFNTLFAFG